MRGFIGALTALGLLAGCGGLENNVEENPELGTREDALPWCGNSSYSYLFHSDDTYSNVVGWEICSCYSSARLGGRRTVYVEVLYEDTCAERP